jgi:prepilin signal peptidase PulO-like enzyme (type II secretory pathway)
VEETVAILMGIMGAAIAAVWTVDIATGNKVDLSDGFFRARDGATGPLLWPHWVAEYATAAALIAAAIGMFLDEGWGRPLAGLALGALFYTSVNSLGWVFARRERAGYAVPMLAGVIVSVLGGVYLLTV